MAENQKLYVYLVTYDLSNDSSDYDELREIIDSCFEDVAKVTVNVFIGSSYKTRSEVFKKLKPIVNKNNGSLIVTTLNGVTYNIKDEDEKAVFEKATDDANWIRNNK